MTLLSIILTLFPAFVLLMAIASSVWSCYSPIAGILSLLFWLYVFPLLIHRIHTHFYPIHEGISYLGSPDYSSWWGSNQIQLIYISFPALEAALRLIPGAFSWWLRLWGAKIGEKVYWTPKIEISDRSLIEIGDRVLLGNDIRMYSHIVKPKKQNLMLYVKKIKIGSDVFLGAGSDFAPGSVVLDHTFVPIRTQLYPNKVFANNNQQTTQTITDLTNVLFNTSG